jgi:hypothetical protein
MTQEMYIQDYSDKAFVLRGDDTREHKAAIKEMRGKWNKSLRNDEGTFSGWIFSKKKREEVETWLEEVSGVTTSSPSSSERLMCSLYGAWCSSESSTDVEGREEVEEVVVRHKEKKRSTKMRLSRLVSTILFELDETIEQDNEFYVGLLGTIAGEVNMIECVTCGQWQQIYEEAERCEQCGYKPDKDFS